ncbi:molybdopterin molybdotransferase MoeA [Pararobbsia alpina]|uniref:Molybdopterin molybdenumtransferase n=1 Tax=Pararobbsia alpina TaxID=621374 RepID=A0A6S7BQW8_9BURK|nr:gephyrin-like molybdotransferase Glp [Pararobbsia alpina]CAB3799567.1 Molybdopterin molybdenumtransferase [Pararobbsia alpina]
MLTFDDAQQRLVHDAPSPTRTELISIYGAAGRVLAEPIHAVLDLPAADNSAMDGYAIRHADFQAGQALPVQEHCFAGETPAPLAQGRATRLFTGSMIPEGADTVVMQEHAREIDGGVEIDAVHCAGQHIRRRGEDIREGQLLLPAGTFVQPAQIGLIAAQGIEQVRVFAKLEVGILTSGDELVEAGNVRAPQQVFNSNAPMLSALVEGMNARVSRVLLSRDNEFELRCAFSQLLTQCDLVISVGGASVGEKDFIKPVLESIGGSLAFCRVLMKPGKPVFASYVAGKPVICLPGNPGAAFSVFALLVSPLIRHMQGRANVFPPVSRIPLRGVTRGGGDRDEFLRVQCRPADDGQAELVPFAEQGAGSVSSMACASGLARIPTGSQFCAGTSAAYYDFRHWLE